MADSFFLESVCIGFRSGHVLPFSSQMLSHLFPARSLGNTRGPFATLRPFAGFSATLAQYEATFTWMLRSRTARHLQGAARRSGKSS